MRRNVLVIASIGALSLSAAASAARLAGTVHLRAGAVSAVSGRGEDEQVRRSTRSLRVDQGERLLTSPDLQGFFIGHDETQVPLEPRRTYQVGRDGVWLVDGDVRLRVLEFLRAPGRGPRRGGDAPDASLANARAAGTPRVRGPRDFETRMMEDDEALGANSYLSTGYEGAALLALVGGGRAVLQEETRVHLQRKALVLREGRLHARSGGPSQLVLTPLLAVAAAKGAHYEVEVGEDGGVRVVCYDGRVVVSPPPGKRGRRHPLDPGREAIRDPGTGIEVRDFLSGQRLTSARDGLASALEGADPEQVARRAREAVRPAPPPVMASGPEEVDGMQVGALPEVEQPPPIVLEEVDEAALAVARSLEKKTAVSSFGSEWEVRDRRRRDRPPSSPGALPPGLMGTSRLGFTAPSHPLWSSAHAVRTPSTR